MILRMLVLVLALGCGVTSTLSAGCERGGRLISEAGGDQGFAGVAGPAGAPGIAGAAGIDGIPGVSGIPGAPGILDFSDFYALKPGNNTATVAPDTPIEFPNLGPTTGVIVPLNSPATSFLLPAIGTYLVLFQASIDEPGQLMLRLNTVPLASTVVGRESPTIQFVGISQLTTTAPNSILEVINAPGNSTALTLTPIAGGTHSVSAHLVIIRIQ